MRSENIACFFPSERLYEVGRAYDRHRNKSSYHYSSPPFGTFGERGGPFTSPRDVARRHYRAVCKPLEFIGGFSKKKKMDRYDFVLITAHLMR